VVLGTRNAKKAEEMRHLLLPHGIVLRSLTDYPRAIDVVEDGDSFATNAQLKATRQAVHLRAWVIGEDSGLCVDALDGAPGIYSARYSGPDATDERNNLQLLEALRDVPLAQRTAHYVCHISLSDPTGTVMSDCEACCQGRIRFEPAGSNGFGYDPLFEIVELHRTFGELGPAIKGVLSHRARAIRQFLPQLLALVAGASSPSFSTDATLG
jgi:XTP/dITP diphosphohydrolase